METLTLDVDLAALIEEGKAIRAAREAKEAEKQKQKKKVSAFAGKVLTSPNDMPAPTEIPKPVMFSHTVIKMNCACGQSSEFLTNRRVKYGYKNGRFTYFLLTHVEKEVAELQLPVEKLISELEVMQCPFCQHTTGNQNE